LRLDSCHAATTIAKEEPFPFAFISFVVELLAGFSAAAELIINTWGFQALNGKKKKKKKKKT
jgi:hypothetical protein